MYRKIKIDNPDIINNVLQMIKLGFSKQQQQILKTNYDRLEYLYYKNES